MINWTLHGIEGVWMTKSEFDTLVKEIERLRGADAGAKQTVTPLTNCVANCMVDGCERRVYAEHKYCTMHRLRFERTGDPLTRRKRGRKASKRAL